MDLDWITLYDYMSIFSRSQIKSKINKFYESFYPLKLKKTGRKQLNLTKIQRVGLMGIIATYIRKVLFALQIYLQAQYFLSSGKIKQQLKLSSMFVQIQLKNLSTSLQLQKTVYIISQAYKLYMNKPDQKNIIQKGFLQIKLLCSLNRIFQFMYSLYNMKNYLRKQGFDILFQNIKQFTIRVCQNSLNHIKLFPQIGQVLTQILYFNSSPQKQSFNFHSHLMQDNKNAKKRTFPLRVKKLFALIPNKQKSLFVNLSNQNFIQFLNKSDFIIPKQTIQNYFRSQQQINSIVAQQQNFIQSILVPQKYRGKPQWKKKVTQQLVNLSVEKQMEQQSKLITSKQFRQTQDFPLHLY